MSEVSDLRRIHTLGKHYVPGRYGKPVATPGIRISMVHPVSIVTIITRAGKTKPLDSAMFARFGAELPHPGGTTEGKSVTFYWCGAEQYFAVATGMAEGALYDALRAAAGDLAAFSDQSHARMMLKVEGPAVRRLLAKGTPVDLHPDAFPQDGSAVTQMAHVGVNLAASGPDGFVLSVFRGFGESFWEWLTSQAAEFGYEVR
ncbi:MAG: sarcosine oxidase subunit gamma [Aestuariivirgaceae bacterium]|nr:sarcosine oxidase subunit gamma [Aestuariivirgaceae bacterium]